MVTSNSPTVLESSTMTVFTEPSNIRIFWGLCFFLYSNISYEVNNTVSKRLGKPPQNQLYRVDSWSKMLPPPFFFFRCIYASLKWISFKKRLKFLLPLQTLNIVPATWETSFLKTCWWTKQQTCTIPHFSACNNPAFFQTPTIYLYEDLHLTRTIRSQRLCNRKDVSLKNIKPQKSSFYSRLFRFMVKLPLCLPPILNELVCLYFFLCFREIFNLAADSRVDQALQKTWTKASLNMHISHPLWIICTIFVISSL